MPPRRLDKLFEERAALKRAVEAFLENRRATLIAPTGYGKTLLSLKLFELADESKLAYRLIHVAPYRALVRETFRRKFKEHYPELSGYQSHEDVDAEDKDPYFMRRLVVTTCDSFFYNLFRVSVGEMRKVLRELSHGHYNVVLASIFTSLVVFDEAHIYLNDLGHGTGEDTALATVLSTLRYLVDMDVPLVLGTATINTSTLSAILERSNLTGIPILYVGGEQSRQAKALTSRGLRVVAVQDPWFTERHSFSWTTEVVEERRALDKVLEFCNSEPVLLIRNTISKAISSYKYLADKCKEAVLVHGLLSNRDREVAIERAAGLIDSGSAGVLVATQVVEAGVELGYRTLVTDLAPAENIAQRAGRLCREASGSFDKCREQGAHVYVIKPDNVDEGAAPYSATRLRETLERIEHVRDEGRSVDWRLFDGRGGYRSFTELIEVLTPITISPPISVAADIYGMYLKSEADPSVLRDLMSLLGTAELTRRSILVNVAVGDKAVSSLREVEYVATDLARVVDSEVKRKPAERCLEYDGDRPRLLIVVRSGGGLLVKEALANATIDRLSSKLQRGGLDMWSAASELSPLPRGPGERLKSVVAVFLKAKESCYERGMGLRLWG